MCVCVLGGGGGGGGGGAEESSEARLVVGGGGVQVYSSKEKRPTMKNVLFLRQFN